MLHSAKRSPALPTWEFLHGGPPDLSEQEIQDVAHDWLTQLAHAAQNIDADAFRGAWIDQGFWRDIIAFTNDYRTLWRSEILQAAQDRLSIVRPSNLNLKKEPRPALIHLFEDYSYIELHFHFDTVLGPATGVARLVFDRRLQEPCWKAFTLLTLLEGVHGHPERTGHNRIRGGHSSKQGWDHMRSAQVDLANEDPDVLIVGAGHNGLQLAARLQAVGLKALVIDTEKRIGDNWRLRYESLSLHDPVYANHMSFLPFPATWPIFSPAGKIANWFESYVDALDLIVWTESCMLPGETTYEAATQQWKVTVMRKGARRTMKVGHIVLATGMSGGRPRLPPPYPGQESFSKAGGQLVHSSKHKTGSSSKGTNALVVGSCTSGHDISLDLVNHGAQATILQRSPTFIMSVENGMPMFHSPLYSEKSPPNEVADRMLESIPKQVLFLHHQRLIPKLAAQDKELLDGLKKAGFQTTFGPEGTGWQRLALEKAGGYYFDVGASAKVIDGTIKVKAGEIDRFDGKTVYFKDGSSASYDTVIFCTGYCGYEDNVRATLGEAWVKHMKPVFGLDEEGETRSVARESGIPRMYWMLGHFALCRILSKVLATQILAENLGQFGSRYTREVQFAGAPVSLPDGNNSLYDPTACSGAIPRST